MKIITDWRQASLRRSSVAIGVFDGVHLGHRAILKSAASAARRRNLRLVALTLHPHPSQILFPQKKTDLLYNPEHRFELLKSIGVQTTVVLGFNRAVAAMTPERFVDRILVRGLDARAVAVGANFKFGQKARGSAVDLIEFGRAKGFEVSAVDPVRLGGRIISSSRIRDAVRKGHFGAAAELLGRPYGLLGRVVRGDGRARGLGFPTLNLSLEHELLPPPGVYAVWAVRNRQALPGVLHLGPRPTFGSTEIRIECHLLESPSKSLYGQAFELIPVRRIRPVRAFASAEALVRQIRRDVRLARLALQTPSQQVY